MNKFYITTAIPYVNAAPHIGFAMEAVQADALARYHMMKGDKTYYLTGVDEHGVKLYETAKEAGEDTQKFADKYAKKFEALKGVLDLTNEGFIRTTSDYHKKGAQKLWKVLADKGDIYKGSYEGLYCAGCEAYVSEKDLIDGKCPNHDKPLKRLKEENYFFKLSKYSDQIKEAILKDELKILPESRKNEMLNIVSDGLHDVSFSRPKDILPWGIDVPGDDSQVMYVWGDALSNYITGIGYGEDEAVDKGGDLYNLFWPCDVHVIGKDILRFHAGIWIGMLMSADLPIPKAIYVHGFVTSEGKKMSKSTGNVVDPLEYVDKYGVDPLRYYLMREVPTGDDGDFSQGRFEDLYNSELANSYGNLVNRVCMMVDRYLDGEIKGKEKNDDLREVIEKFWEKYEDGMNNFNIKVSCEAVLKLLDYGNKYVEDQKPWELAKVDMDSLAAVLYNLLEVVRNVSLMLWPIIPGKATEVLERIGLKPCCLSDVGKDCGYGEHFGYLKEGSKVLKGDPLFPKLEVED
ncbi:methionine--tRNA ligase [Candidatus Peregrinibacteria bacterium]|jgi:methionyl-tRNA synthetase|nr:methionine--tRNA ligase [Candidatus Peregrinibacteria bacterium]MBT4148415.1 methionine--tRNA ligase [Candidatus Peregrinibacteria bacterium]MBT4366474.1 methionine--tRNA ligase [Candidatus Peregrinibacteria bacterium]MBT4456075.1 methionine--tRNA ligase [Candidatus Peregrinibacteria bacterium]